MKTARYKVNIELVEPALGTQPQRDVASEWTKGKAREQGLDVEAELETLPEMLERGTTVFHKDEHGNPILWDFQVKGFLKEAGSVLNGTRNVKNLRSKVADYVFVYGRKIPLRLPKTMVVEVKVGEKKEEIPSVVEGEGLVVEKTVAPLLEYRTVPAAVTYKERPLRANTPQGPRTALARSEMVPVGTTFSVEIEVLMPDKNKISKELLCDLLDYGSRQGLLQWRGGGWGRFKYTLEALESGEEGPSDEEDEAEAEAKDSPS